VLHAEVRPTKTPDHASIERRSATVALWTLLSRATGLLRVVVAGAVLGPTFFANTFQSANSLPNITYTLVAGSVLAMVIVPVCVHALERQGIKRARQLVQRLSGIILEVALLLMVGLIAISPLLAYVFTTGVDASDRGRARLFVVLLIVLVSPQIPCYLAAALGAAIQQVHGRFAVAAAAPALENVGLIVTLLVVRQLYRPGLEVGSVPIGLVVILAGGSTLSVGAHAAIQVAAARRTGMGMRPRLGGRKDRDVREITTRLLGSVRIAAFPALGFLAMIVVSSTVRGGVLVFQTALALYNVPVALGARAIATAVLPGLSEAAAKDDQSAFAAELRRGLWYSTVAGVGASCVLITLAQPLANLLTNGALRSPELITRLAICTAVVGFAQFAASLHEMGRQGLFAQLDIAGPRRASERGLLATLAMCAAALAFPVGNIRMALVCAGLLASDLVSSATVIVALRRLLPCHVLIGARGVLKSAMICLAMLSASGLTGLLLERVSFGRAMALVLIGIGGSAWAASVLGVMRFHGRNTTNAERENQREQSTAATRQHHRRNTPIAQLAKQGERSTRARPQSPGGASAATTHSANHLGWNPQASRERERGASAARTWPVLLGTIVALATTVSVSATYGPIVPVVLIGLSVLAVTAWRPVYAVYGYLVTLPFIAGIGRGKLVPLVRPNEALLAAVIAGALVGAYVRYVGGHSLKIRLTRPDGVLLAFLVLSVVWPICSLLLRSRMPSVSELMALFPMTKLAALFVLVRVVVSTNAGILRCLRLIIWPAVVLGLIAIGQTLRVGPVVSTLARGWTADASVVGITERGSTTLASSIATGDYLVVALALVVMLGVRELLPRTERLVAAFVLTIGILAAGQFSTWVAALVVAMVLGAKDAVLRRKALRFLPALPIVALVGAPAFIGRVSGFFDGFGVPRSWIGRYDNLTHFYLPGLGNFRFVLGVSPNTVLPAPELWRTQIFLESGYLSLLWIGGIPLLLGFIWLSVELFQRFTSVARRRDARGAVASAMQGIWWMVVVLSLIDVHLVLRGFGDALAVLIALVTGRIVAHDAHH
jgi:peptidoglycan biosynthesis protein MviN/MurJ (putative lipid II flippase)